MEAICFKRRCQNKRALNNNNNNNNSNAAAWTNIFSYFQNGNNGNGIKNGNGNENANGTDGNKNGNGNGNKNGKRNGNGNGCQSDMGGLTDIHLYLFSSFSNVCHSACVWPTALKLGCISNFDMLFLVMGFIYLVDESQCMLIYLAAIIFAEGVCTATQ